MSTPQIGRDACQRQTTIVQIEIEHHVIVRIRRVEGAKVDRRREKRA